MIVSVLWLILAYQSGLVSSDFSSQATALTTLLSFLLFLTHSVPSCYLSAG